MPRRAAFTVLELMLVIGVLSVLLAIVLPTIKTVHTFALKKQAAVEATALAQAAIRYKTEYGFWPGQLQANDDGTVKLRTELQGTSFIPVIISGPKTFTDQLEVNVTPVYLNENEVYQAFRRVGTKEGTRFKPNPLNPKGIHFLDLENESDPLTVNFPDPWNSPSDRRGYILFMGLNPRSTFTHTVKTEGSGTPFLSVSISNTIAFAFSFGPEGRNSTNYIYSAGAK